MPRNFVEDLTSISVPSTFRGLLRDQFLLFVNMTTWVFSWLSFRPWVLHHWLILFRLLWVTSRKVSESKPWEQLPGGFLGLITIDTSAMSSANPWRSHGIISLVNSNNSFITRFHRNGDRIPPAGILVIWKLPSPFPAVLPLWFYGGSLTWSTCWHQATYSSWIGLFQWSQKIHYRMLLLCQGKFRVPFPYWAWPSLVSWRVYG